MIFTLGTKLCVHSDHVIKKGRMGVYNQQGTEILEVPVRGAEYFSVNLNVAPGIYLVRLCTETQIIEKKTFIGK